MKTEGIIGQVASIRDKANRLILELLRQQGIKDLAPAHGGIFIHLFQNQELTMGRLAGLIERDKSTLTALVKKLTRLGYLKSRKDDQDQRITLLSLTGKGRALEKDFQSVSERLLEKTYSGFSQGEKLVLVEMLARINTNLDPENRKK